jgi:hypothetical protein
MLCWLLRVRAGLVAKLSDIPAGTRRALERRLLVSRDPDSLRPRLLPDGHRVADGAVAAFDLAGFSCWPEVL